MIWTGFRILQPWKKSHMIQSLREIITEFSWTNFWGSQETVFASCMCISAYEDPCMVILAHIYHRIWPNVDESCNIQCNIHWHHGLYRNIYRYHIDIILLSLCFCFCLLSLRDYESLEICTFIDAEIAKINGQYKPWCSKDPRYCDTWCKQP